MSFKMALDTVRENLAKAGYNITREYRNGNNLAVVLRLSNGCIVNCWDNGTVSIQGKCTDEVEKAIRDLMSLPIHNRLKPCPFCGGEAKIEHHPEFGFAQYLVKCYVCHATFEYGFYTKESAEEAWNRRFV